MVEFKKVTKKFNKQEVFSHLSLQIKKGEKIILTGPSGGGKTTLLRVLIGLENADEGSVDVGVESSQIAWIPQDLGLWANLSVYQNVKLVCKERGKEAKNKIQNLLESLGIDHLLKKKVSRISAGEKQRVALARALVNEAKLLVLDEPFSSLDLELRTALFKNFNELLPDETTLICITHDPYDAKGLVATRIIVLEEGVVKDLIDYNGSIPENVKSRTLQLWRQVLVGG